MVRALARALGEPEETSKVSRRSSMRRERHPSSSYSLPYSSATSQSNT